MSFSYQMQKKEAHREQREEQQRKTGIETRSQTESEGRERKISEHNCGFFCCCLFFCIIKIQRQV